MRCMCISCFNHYDTRMKAVIDYYNKIGYEVTYLISDFDHFTKEKFVVNYPNTYQISVPPYRKNLSLNRLLSHYIFSKKVFDKLIDIKPELIYCMFPPNSLVKEVARYKKVYKCKVTFDCYDLWPESFPYQKLGKILQYLFQCWKRLRDKYIENADLLLCVSETGRKVLSEMINSIPIRILKPSLEQTGVIKYNSDLSNGIVFCYLGNVNHITDIELCTNLLSALAKHVKVKVHFIGEGQNLEDFTTKLINCGIEIVRHGVIFDMAEKNNIFSQCNFGLNIPRKEIQSSMSLKSVEYMCAGLPFLNSGIGDTFLLVKERNVGINISNLSIDAIIKNILNLTSEDLNKMHQDCVMFYKEKFSAQDYNEVLKI